MAGNDKILEMNPKKNAKIKKALIKTGIFEKSSYTPYIGDEYEDAEKKFLFIGNSKYPADDNFIEDIQEQNYPRTNYCSQITSYCKQDLKSIETKRLGKKTIRVVKTFTKQERLDLNSICFYNFYYDRFVKGVEIPDQGFKSKDERLFKYQNALMSVIKILKPNKILCESYDLEFKIDGRCKCSESFEGKSFSTWIGLMKIEDCTPRKREKVKKVGLEKKILKSCNDNLFEIRRNLTVFLDLFVEQWNSKHDEDFLNEDCLNKLFEILIVKSIEEIDLLVKQWPIMLMMIHVLNKMSFENVDELTCQELLKTFLILDSKSYKQVDDLSNVEIKKIVKTHIEGFYETEPMNLKAIREVLEMLAIECSFELNNDEEKILNLRNRIPYFIDDLNDGGLKKILQLLIRLSFEMIGVRNCYEIMELSTNVKNEFYDRDYFIEDDLRLRGGDGVDMFDIIDMFKCLKRLLLVSHAVGGMGEAEYFKILLDLLDEKKFLIAEECIPLALEYIKETYESPVSWIKKTISVNEISNYLKGFSPIASDKRNGRSKINGKKDNRGFWAKLDEMYWIWNNDSDDNKKYANLMKKRIMIFPSKARSPWVLPSEKKEELLNDGYRKWEPRRSKNGKLRPSMLPTSMF